MKKILFGFCCIFIMQTMMAQKVNFTGKWKIDKDKSSFGEAPAFVVPAEINVAQKADSLYLSIININENGEQNSASAKYPLNGNGTERAINDSLKLVGSFSWSKDKNSLIKNQEYINNKQAFRKLKEVWTLSEEGKLLTIEQTVEIMNDDGYSVKAVYVKN